MPKSAGFGEPLLGGGEDICRPFPVNACIVQERERDLCERAIWSESVKVGFKLRPSWWAPGECRPKVRRDAPDVIDGFRHLWAKRCGCSCGAKSQFREAVHTKGCGEDTFRSVMVEPRTQ